MFINWQLLETQVGVRFSALKMLSREKGEDYVGFAGGFVGAGGCSGRGRSEEVVLPAGQRGARMAEMQVPSGELRAMKGCELEGGRLERDGNRGCLLAKTQRGRSVFFQQHL